MNGVDFFFSPSDNGKDDDWGEFVDSSPRISPNPTPDRIQPEKQWVTSRSPVPLSVFGETEEDEEGSGAPVSSFNFSFDSFSNGDGTGSVVNMSSTLGINGLIANLYSDKAQNDNLEVNKNQLQTISHDLARSLSSLKTQNSAATLDNLNWNPLNLNSTSDDGDGWEFKTAVSIFQSADGVPKEGEENARSGSLVVQNTNGTCPSFYTGKVDAVWDGDNGDDDSWEFKVAEAAEDSSGWAFGSDFQPVSEIETAISFQSNSKKELQNGDGGSSSFPINANVNSGGGLWAFQQPSSETGNEKEEKQEQTEKPKGVLPLSFFEDEKLGTSDSFVHEDDLVLSSDFSVREKTKETNQVSINDLISSLYSQVEGNHAANLSGFVSVEAATDSNLVNGEDDSWDFQGPTKNITDMSITEGADDFGSNGVFAGSSLTLKNTDVTEGVDYSSDGSWEFQGPTESVRDFTSRKGDTGSWESKHSSMVKEVGNRFSVTDAFGDLPEKPVTSIEPNDYKDFFFKLKTELYYIALNHLEALKEARNFAADSNEDAEVRKCDADIKDLQNWLNNDALSSEVNLEILQPRSSKITELSKALHEPKFRALASEDLLSEGLLLVEKDWKSTIELLKYATLTLKILNLGSPEQQSEYASIWSEIASTCAQELQHATSIWKQVIENDIQEEILSTPQGKSWALSAREIYRVVKILIASTRLYRPWILLTPKSYNVLGILDECVKLWLSSGLEEALQNNFYSEGFDGDYSTDQLQELIEVDPFILHTRMTSATSRICYISGLSAEIVPEIKMVEWNGEHYLVPLVNLWANLISREPPSLAGHYFPTLS